MVRVYRKDLVGFYEVSEARARELEKVGYTRNKAEADAGRNDPGGTTYMGVDDTPTKTTTTTKTTKTEKKNTTESSNTGLTQIRLKSGSYSDVDSTLVDAYIRGDYGDIYKGAVKTSDLPEFQDTGKTVTRYNEDNTVTYSDNTTEEASKALNYNQSSSSSTTTSSTTTNESSSTDSGYDEAKNYATALYSYLPQNVLNEFITNYINTGDPEVSIGLTRKSQPWLDNFSYLLNDDGTLAMDELTALSTINTYKQTLKEVGIDDFTDFEDEFKEMVTSVSGAEFQERIDTVYAGVVDQIPEVMEIYSNMLGITADAPTVFAALINPKIEDKFLRGQIATVQIGAQSKKAGFGFSYDKFDMLRKAGLTENQAKNLYQGAGNVLASADRLGMSLDLDTLESAAVGDAASQRRLSRLGGAVESASSAVIGAQRNKAGITGLIEE